MTAKIKNLIVRALTGIIFVGVLVSSFLSSSALFFCILFSIITGLSVWEFSTIVNKQEEIQINPICPFFTRQLHLVGIDDNHIITAIHMRSIARFVFTTQYLSNFCTHTTQNLVGCINNNPLFFSGLFVCRNGLIT